MHKASQHFVRFETEILTSDDYIPTVKRAMRSSRPLKSTAILSQRSAVPALLSRTTTRKHGRLTPEEKERLLKLGKRKRKFLGSFVESSEIGGVALEQRSAYDVWEEDESEDERLKKVLKTDEAKEYLLPLVKKPKVKVGIPFIRIDCVTLTVHFQAPSKDVRKEIGLPAIADPHPGTSYNPTTSAHNELLLAANRVEEEKEKEVEKLAGVSATIEAAKRSYVTDERDEGAPSGMKIDVAEEGSEEEEEGEDADIVASKPPPRKTKQQRQKAARVLAEVRFYRSIGNASLLIRRS
jgi:nucleolar protein 53